MSEQQHTPGPWTAFDDEIVSHYTDAHIADVPLLDGTNPTEWQANMHLIAAAPDLLEAVRGVDVLYAELHAAMPWIVGKPGYDIVTAAVDKARAAIAKAEGRP